MYRTVHHFQVTPVCLYKNKGNTVNRIRTFVYDLDQNQLLILVAGYYKGDKYEIGSIREISNFNIVKFVLKR